MKNLFLYGVMLIMSASLTISCGEGEDDSTSEESNQSNIIPSGTIDGHEYVDLGLSVKWATCNVGASSPYDCGNYIAWGMTEPIMSQERQGSDWAYYKWYGGNNDMTKYCNIDGKTVLDLEDDAAYVNWRNSWRMPTKEEFKELIDNCTWTWDDTEFGYRVQSNKEGYTYNKIFLPAAGYADAYDTYFRKQKVNESLSGGYYWTSSLSENSSDNASILFFDSNSYCLGGSLRYCGQSIRPVIE